MPAFSRARAGRQAESDRRPADLALPSPAPVGCARPGVRGGAVLQLTLANVKARIERLDQLARGLAKEVGLQRGAEDVLLSRERRQYLAGVHDALAGGEAARVVLARAMRRMEGA